MEYTQITLNDWIEMKNKLRRELLSVRQSFVRIGYMLRQVEEQKLYEQDGYKSVAEFAQKELSLHPTTTSRFMEINREYSVDGYSERLDEKYMDFGRSQLEEMLKLPEEDRQMITPQTAREDIRELKRFNAAGPEQGADDLQSVIAGFLQENKEIAGNLYHSAAYEQNDTVKMTELVIPSGNKTYRKGLYFLSMTDNDIKIKKFGGSPETMTWEHFFEIVRAELEQNPPKEEEQPEEKEVVEKEKPDKQQAPETLHDIAPDIPESKLTNPPKNIEKPECKTTFTPEKTAIPVSPELTQLQGIILDKVGKLVTNIKGSMWLQALMDLKELEEDVQRAQHIEDTEETDEEI